jgi:hypothetical protein
MGSSSQTPCQHSSSDKSPGNCTERSVQTQRVGWGTVTCDMLYTLLLADPAIYWSCGTPDLGWDVHSSESMPMCQCPCPSAHSTSACSARITTNLTRRASIFLKRYWT